MWATICTQSAMDSHWHRAANAPSTDVYRGTVQSSTRVSIGARHVHMWRALLHPIARTDSGNSYHDPLHGPSSRKSAGAGARTRKVAIPLTVLRPPRNHVPLPASSTQRPVATAASQCLVAVARKTPPARPWSGYCRSAPGLVRLCSRYFASIWYNMDAFALMLAFGSEKFIRKTIDIILNNSESIFERYFSAAVKRCMKYLFQMNQR